MANNPNVNKVVYGNQTVMDITDTTAEPENVLEGEVFYDRSGTRQTGSVSLDDYFLRSEQRVLGAKNLLPHIDNTEGTFTINGVTWTVNSDGSITANGTASGGNSIFRLSNTYIPNVSKGLIFSAGLTDSYASICFAALLFSSTGATYSTEYDLLRTESVVPSTYDIYPYFMGALVVRNGETANNITFKPMLRLPSDPDDTFAPYTLTNKELTDALGTKADASSLATVATSGDYGDLENTPTLADVATSGDYEDLINTPDLDSFYSTDDAAGTSLDNADNFPFYDDSATAKKNITWNDLKSLMKSGISTTSVAANSADLITSGGVYNALPHTIGTVATVSAGQSVRIPASGTDDRITTNVSYIYIPFADSDNGKPVKISNMSVYSGYLTITVAQALSAQYIGVIIANTIS